MTVHVWLFSPSPLDPSTTSEKDAGLLNAASDRDHPGCLELGRNSPWHRCCGSKGFVIIRRHQAVLAGNLAQARPVVTTKGDHLPHYLQTFRHALLLSLGALVRLLTGPAD